MELLENYKLYIDKDQILKHNTSEIKAKQVISDEIYSVFRIWLIKFSVYFIELMSSVFF